MPDIFLHVPKTGGTTLATTLRWVYGPRSCHQYTPDRPEDHKAFLASLYHAPHEPDLLMGHVQWGLHRYVDAECRYFTLLRHPVRRRISEYYYLKGCYPDSYGASLTLKEFVRSDHPMARSNDQVRYLSGVDPDQSPTQALEKAKNHLTGDVVFGLTERFYESLLLLRRRLNWTRPPFYVSSNKNRTRPTLEDLSPDIGNVVRDQHQLDLELYQWAQSHFQEMLETEFSSLPRTRRRFHRQNRWILAIAPSLLWMYRSARSLMQT